jgi:hypothetical protein
LDFIGYAHFETHCDESLAELDQAWKDFHDAKGVFVDLEIRKHFNINKLHNVKHYVESIRSRGTTDGFNSEASERLHIDYAKLGYRASNKNYTVQMVRWLTRQESVSRFTAYLQWAMPHYAAQQEAADVDDEDDEDEDEPEGVKGEDEEDSDVEEEPTYHIAKTAPFPKTPISTLAREYKAPDFLYHLQNFMNTRSIAPRRH